MKPFLLPKVFFCYNQQVQDYISIIKSKNPDLKEAEIIGLLYILNSKDKISGNDLILLTGIPKPVMKVFKSSIAELLASKDKEALQLNEKGLEIVSKKDLKPYKWTLLEYEVPKDLADKFHTIRKKYNSDPKRELDQFFATPEATISKAKILCDKGLGEQTDIAIIGDDDLVSIALSLLSPKINKIKVFDADESLLKLITDIAQEYSLKNIETQFQDVRNSFKNIDLRKFDVVVTDPPYTKSGVQLFLHRSIELLKEHKNYDGSYIMFNYGNGLKNPEKTIKIQHIINQFNLVIEDTVSKFTRYVGAETVGSTSSLYFLKTTPQTKVDHSVLTQNIYTFEKIPEENFPYVDHYVIKINNVSKSLLNSKSSLEKNIGEFCRRHNLKVVDRKVTKFKGEGFSFTYILSNSNLVVHTWPEYNALHIDLITCTSIHRKEALAENISKLFETKHIEVRHIE